MKYVSTRDGGAPATLSEAVQRGLAQWLAINLEPVEGRYRWRIEWDVMEEMLRDYFRTDLWDTLVHPPEEAQIHIVKATESNSLDEEAERRVEMAGTANGRVFLHRLEGGHWINTDNPEAVIALLRDNLP